MKTNRKINTLLVGLGRIASGLELDPLRLKPCTHAGVLFSPWGKKHFSLQGFYDQDLEKIGKFQKQWRVSSTGLALTSEEFLGLAKKKDQNQKQEYDFAIVATTSHTHFEIACHLIRSGIKFILIEKPVSLNSHDAKKLAKLARENKVKIWINHERRYHPRYQYVKELLSKGAYGKIESVRANVFTSAKNPGLAFSKFGGGPLLHDGTHAVDLLFWILGPLNLRAANVVRPTQKSIEDKATAWLVNKDQVDVFLDVAGGRDYFQFEIDIFTTKARLVLSNDGFQLFASDPSPLYKGFRSLRAKEWKKIPDRKRSNAFLGIYQEILNNVKGKSDYQEGTLEDNIDILECIESIYRFRRKK